MPVLGWAFCAIFVAIAMPGVGEIVAVLTLFLLALPASAVFLAIQLGVSSMGLDGRTTQTVSIAMAIALVIVIAGVLLLLLNRLAMSDHRRDSLANALVLVIGVPVCMGAAYYRAKGMFESACSGEYRKSFFYSWRSFPWVYTGDITCSAGTPPDSTGPASGAEASRTTTR
jgi:nitrate reductase gamma subunit